MYDPYIRSRMDDNNVPGSRTWSMMFNACELDKSNYPSWVSYFSPASNLVVIRKIRQIPAKASEFGTYVITRFDGREEGFETA